MSTILLQYSTEHSLSSWAIRWWTDSEWSHVDAVLPNGDLLGARPDYPIKGRTGVQIRPKNYAPFSKTRLVEIATEGADTFYALLRGEIGKPYARGKILNFVVDQDDRWQNGKAYFCDELVLAMARRAGIFPHKLAIPFSKVAPGASLLAFSVLPGYQET